MATIYKRKQDKTNRRACWYIGYTDYRGKRTTAKGFTDKAATEQLAASLEDDARQIRAGLKPVPIAAGKEPIAESIARFREHLETRDITDKQVNEVIAKVTRLVEVNGWTLARQITDADIERQLAVFRTQGMSKRTSNHYVRAMKQFARWLAKTRRLRQDPLLDLAMLNADTDRRHPRRPLSPEELTRLVAAAETGTDVEGISGIDRAMMYLIAAWTGYRKGEIGSLRSPSFALASEPPTVTVEAQYSKAKRQDTQVLHPDLAGRIAAWLKGRNVGPDEILFPVSKKTTRFERKTAKMMRADLAAARKAWLEESESEAEMAEREQSDFLKYQDHQKRFADFHANRHTFITNLSKVGVSAKTAQTMARHSDIRLTMNTYTHTELAEKQAAVQKLAGLWECFGSAPNASNGVASHSVASASRSGSRESESEPSAEDVAPSAVGTTRHELTLKSKSTPRRARTSNLRFRRPMLYPIELGVQLPPDGREADKNNADSAFLKLGTCEECIRRGIPQNAA